MIENLFKFTFFGIEYSKNNAERKITEGTEEQKMSRHKLTRQQKRFQKAVRKCHHTTFAPRTFGLCMKRELKG